MSDELAKTESQELGTSRKTLQEEVVLEDGSNGRDPEGDAKRYSSQAKAAMEAAESAAAATAHSEKSAEAALTEAQTKLADIQAIATAALASKTQITDEQAVVATKSAHIQRAQEHSDTVRANLDRTLTDATQQATETGAQLSRAQAAAQSATSLFGEMQTLKSSMEADREATNAALTSARESAGTTKALADISKQVEERISGYESRLSDFEQQCAEQLKTIEGLLPGAASAGLASAFDKRSLVFQKPHYNWQRLSMLFMCLLAIVAFEGLCHVYQSDVIPTYDTLFRLLLTRLPLAGALGWLAYYSSREAALAKRLEEDYGYKAAIAATFLGFHKHLSALAVDVTTNPPLSKLCDNTLATISDPPGRIYDKNKLVISPAEELTGLLNGLTDLLSKFKSNVTSLL